MKKIVVAVSLFSVFAAFNAFAVEPIYMVPDTHHPESQDLSTSDRVPEIMAYEPSTLTTTKDGETTLSDDSSKAVSIETIYSKNIKTINLPLSYGMPVDFLDDKKERINFCAVLPYTERDNGIDKESGLGDISISTDYLVKFKSWLLDSKLTVKFPTGEVKDSKVALGTGTYDIGALFKTTFYRGKFAYKAGFGYTLTGDYEDAGFELIYGDDIFLSGGVVYSVNDTLSAGGELVFNSHGEDEIKNGGGSSFHAGLVTYDLIPSVTWFYSRYKVNVTGKAVIPVFNDWNTDKGTDPSEDPEREAKLKIEISKPF